MMAIKRNPRAAEIRSAQAVAEVDQNEKIPTIHFVPAYDGGVCDLSPKEVWPYPVVFDLAGMEPIQVLPIVRDHNQDLPIGQTESVKYGPNAITAVGKMLNVGIDESADKILKLAKRGAKLQASISTDLIGREEIEFFDRGQQVEVNGQIFEGPIEVVKKTKLREITICTVGANAGTAVEIQAKKGVEKMGSLISKALAAFKAGKINKKETLNRIAKAKATEGEPEEKIEAEGGDFNEWLIAKGFDPAGLSDEVLEALLKVFEGEGTAEAKATEGEEEEQAAEAEEGDEEKTGCAAEGDEEEQTAEAEDGEEEEEIAAKSKAKSKYVFIRQSPKSRKAISASYRTYEGPAGGGAPDPVRVATAALLVSSGINPDSLQKKRIRANRWGDSVNIGLGDHGFTDRELDEAVSGKNRTITPLSLLIKAKMIRPDQIRDSRAIIDSMNSAKFAAQATRAGFARSAQAAGAGNLGTADVPNIFADVMYKSMLVAFKETDDWTDRLSRVTNANDFRTQHFWTLETGGNFEEVKENGELPVLNMKDADYTNKVKLRGAELRYSYEQLINDDQDALTYYSQNLGRRCREKKMQIWWGALCAGLSANSATVGVSSNPTLTLDGLNAAFAKMKQQYDGNGEPVVLKPKYVVTPYSLWATARGLCNQTELIAAGGNTFKAIPNVNEFAGMFEAIASEHIGAGSKNSSTWGANGWALISEPEYLPAMILSYLKGSDAPTMETVNGDFTIQGVRVGCWWAFGAAFGDGKAIAFSTGAGS